MKKFGMIDSQPDVVHPTQGYLGACRRTYEDIQVPGELTILIFGYDLGEMMANNDNRSFCTNWIAYESFSRVI
jgi:hypothetical protein